MLRKVMGIIAGYLFVVIFTVLSLWLVYSLMGTEWAFKPESYEASTRWALTSVIVGFIGAVIAGWVCFVVSKSGRAVKALAGVFIVLGLSLAVFTMTQDRTAEIRPTGMSFIAAGEKAYSPTWYNFAIPIVGAVGVLIGGGMMKGDWSMDS